MHVSESPVSPLTRLAASWWSLVVLVVLLLAIHVPTLGVPPLAGTEGHRIVPAREMLESGDLIVPTLYHRVYLMKPPMYPWILAAMEFLFGGNTWTWRLPSTICHALILVQCFVFGRRWFGPLGGTLSGLGFVLMVGLWQEARTADIDPLNTFLSSLSAMILLEIMLGKAQRLWAWTAFGLAALMGAMFAKVVGVLPVLLAVVIGAPIAARVRFGRKDAGELAPMHLAQVLIVTLPAIIPTAIWRFTALARMARAGIPLEADGAVEGLAKMVPHSVGQFLSALLNPFVLFAYGLPVSVGLLFAFHPAIRARRFWPGPERMTFAIAVSIVTGFLICVVSGMDNERYAYVIFPLFPLLAAGVVTRLYREHRGGDLAAGWLAGCGAAFVGAQVVILFLVRKAAYAPTPIPAYCWAAAAVGVPLAVASAMVSLRRAFPVGVVLLLGAVLCFDVPFSEYSDRRRDAHSGKRAAEYVAKFLPEGAVVTSGAYVRYQPEFFYYLGHPVKSLWRTLPDTSQYPGHTWVILHPDDKINYVTDTPQRVVQVVPFESNKTKAWLVELAPAQNPN